MKPLWQSKTAWINLIAALAAFFPPVQVWVAANPEFTVLALGAVNVILRVVSKGAITLSPNGGNGGPSGGTVPLGLLALTAAGIVGLLPSCANTVTTTTMPDGSQVVVRSQSSDPAALRAACDLATEVLPLLDHLADEKGGCAETKIKQTSVVP